MRIGELATAAGVPTSRIRFYETAGLLVPDGRTQAGYRIYGEPALQARALPAPPATTSGQH